MNQYENIDELIAKCLAEEASVAEKDIVHNWIATSENNKRYYSEMKLIFEVAGEKIVSKKVNVSDAWEKFSKQLPEQNGKETILKKLTSSFYSKAAIFICALGLGYFVYSQLNTAEKEIIFSSSVSNQRSNTLPDGTFIVLNAQSSISYSSSFNSSNRALSLTGEAYFKVTHNEELPFIVNTGTVFIKDVGTSFTVKARPTDSTVVVTMEEGEVIFYSSQHPGITLVKNETGIYNVRSKTFRKKEETQPSADLVKNQTLSFENTSLRFVIDTLNKAYNEHIVLSCEKLGSLELTATFKETSVKPIIETIAETFGLSVTRTNGSISLSGQACKD